MNAEGIEFYQKLAVFSSVITASDTKGSAQKDRPMSPHTSRRSLVIGAAALPALAVPAIAAAITGTVPVSLIEADEHPRRTTNKIVEIADKMIAEYHRLGTLGRDIEKEDWETYDALEEQLWEPSQSIDDVTAKARVLDQRLRCGGKVHSVLHVDFAWDAIDDLLALQVQ
jgi:hypothetical protein